VSSPDGQLGPHAYLAAAALLAVLAEEGGGVLREIWPESRDFGPLTGFAPYLRRRARLGQSLLGQSGEPQPVLPYLPVPEGFRQLFRDWADGKVSLSGS
jgi:hypothetical protein